MGNTFICGKKLPIKECSDQDINKLNKFKIQTICQCWASILKLNGLTEPLVSIIVKYAYFDYDISLYTDQNRKYHHLYKLVLIGSANTGKSMIKTRFADDCFSDSYIATIGIDFKTKCDSFDGKMIMLQIWDPSGQGIFRQIVKAYYRGARGVFIVFDITNRKSFEDVKNYWMIEIAKYAQHGTAMMLIGAKCDLKHERKVSKIEAEHWSKIMGCMEYLEVSAKDNINIDCCFEKMVKYIREISEVKYDENLPFIYPCSK